MNFDLALKKLAHESDFLSEPSAPSANALETPLTELSAEESPNREADGTNGLIEEILTRNLFEPVRELFSRPSKLVRASLVRAGFHMAGPISDRRMLSAFEESCCDRLAEVLEAIHAGSLIVDDIQDGSKERRGSPSLHIQYGIPVALNAGNWLYFQPFDWIKKLGLAAETELLLYRVCHEAMLNAHLGQAIDLGTSIDKSARESVRSVCMTSLRLKTGALTSLALSVGAILGGATPARLAAISDFGSSFGVALQMFDDIGNFKLPAGHPKRMEDFRLRRPTWLWAIASETGGPSEYEAFIDCVNRLPDEAPLLAWIVRHELLESARTEAHRHLAHAEALLAQELGELSNFPLALSIVQELSERIRKAYG